MHKLVIQDDEGKTTVVPLIKDEITVGRKEGNTIRLTERNVSRRHARIMRSNGTVEIEDLDSYNGVKVNGARIQGRTHLNPSDRIQIGDYLIELKSDGSPGSLNSSTVDEQPTRPIPQASGSASAIPQIRDGIEDAETTKMPANFTFAGMMSQPPAPIDPRVTTDPGRTAVAIPSEVMAVPEAVHGRLVILSEHFAGQEYDLAQPTMVIGRTDDNDIVINHRSISRHHAKVVVESGRYAIVDLQSSNGVRVNGEEYGRAELRRGDVIDLGHVRLRFIEPGEDFLFGRDAQAVPIPSGGGRGWLYGALVLLVILGAAGVFALTRGDDGDQEVVTPNVPQTSTTADAGEGSDASPSIPPRKSVNDEILALRNQAQAAIDSEQWTEVATLADRIFALDANNETARELKTKAEHMKRNQDQQAAFDKLCKAPEKDFEKIARAFKAFDSDSPYKDRARDCYETVAKQYIAARVNDAKKAGKNCARIAGLLTQTEEMWKEVSMQALQDLLSRCQQQQGRPNPNTNNQNNNATSNPPDAGTSSQSGDEDDKSNKTFEELNKEQGEFARKGLYGAALKSCKQAYKKQSSQELGTLCGVYACKSRQIKDAKRFFDKADASHKAGIKQTCLSLGIDLTR